MKEEKEKKMSLNFHSFRFSQKRKKKSNDQIHLLTKKKRDDDPIENLKWKQQIRRLNKLLHLHYQSIIVVVDENRVNQIGKYSFLNADRQTYEKKKENIRQLLMRDVLTTHI